MIQGKGRYCVYKITHRETNRSYIGLTNDFERRKKEHLKVARNGSSHYLHRTIRKYGEASFEWTVLIDGLSLDAASREERLMIDRFDTYRSGFNMTTGGESGWTKITQQETKDKLASLYLGKTYEQLHGAEKAVEIRRKISTALTGRPASESFKRIMSAIIKRRRHEMGRPVIVDGVSYESVSAAALALGACRATIRDWVGQRRSRRNRRAAKQSA